MPFLIRKLSYQLTLGEKLKALRLESRRTLSESAEQTKIRKSVLRLFETNTWHKLPDPLYTRHLLKMYVKSIGGEVNYFLDLYEQERGTCDLVTTNRLPRQKTHAFRFVVASRIAHISFFFILLTGLVGYLGWQIQTIIQPPDLLVFEPADGFKTEQATIMVSGKAESGSRITVNGADVLIAKDGSFRESVVLERGLNIITVEGSKRYSRRAIEYRRVLVNHDRELSLQ